MRNRMKYVYWTSQFRIFFVFHDGRKRFRYHGYTSLRARHWRQSFVIFVSYSLGVSIFFVYTPFNDVSLCFHVWGVVFTFSFNGRGFRPTSVLLFSYSLSLSPALSFVLCSDCFLSVISVSLAIYLKLDIIYISLNHHHQHYAYVTCTQRICQASSIKYTYPFYRASEYECKRRAKKSTENERMCAYIRFNLEVMCIYILHVYKLFMYA